MLPVIDVAIVGAGPYGLSAAAHTLAAGLDTCVFGRPMRAWEHHMPQGMLLKSEPSASNLADPRGRHDLAAYCRWAGLPYGYGQPVPLETFVDYGKWFQAQAVADAVDTAEVTGVRAEGKLFAVELASGRRVMARAVVLALGFLPFARRPAALTELPPTVCTHSSEHSDLSRFEGLDVTVVGAGQSALETATLLLEAGARPRVLARAAALEWNGTPEPSRSLVRRVLAPRSGLGTGWRSWTWAERPGLVRHLPLTTRRHIVRTTLGPAGSWWLRERFDGRIPVLTGHSLVAAKEDLGVRLTLKEPGGESRTLHTEHVIAATGYEVDVARIGILDVALRAEIGTEGTTPRLNRTFETSVPGLYMIGLAAAATFGPVMRFVHGADFAARRVTRGLTAAAGSRRHYRRETGAGLGTHRLNA